MSTAPSCAPAASVAWAFRGFNPHHRKDPSYYPLLAHLAQTGHILRLKNRPGNVHDSKQAAAFLREVIDGLRGRFGRRLPLEFRMDAAFFQRDVLRLLPARGCHYAIKVGYWSWLPLKQLAAERERWLPIAPEVTGFFHDLDIPQWNLRLRVMIYRKHVAHESPKNFQLDLFTPDDGHYEYAAVATNLDPGSPRALRLHLWARRPGEDPGRTQGRVRPRCRPDALTTGPTVPGSNSASSPTISPAASNSTPSPPRNRALANAPMRT